MKAWIPAVVAVVVSLSVFALGSGSATRTIVVDPRGLEFVTPDGRLVANLECGEGRPAGASFELYHNGRSDPQVCLTTGLGRGLIMLWGGRSGEAGTSILDITGTETGAEITFRLADGAAARLRLGIGTDGQAHITCLDGPCGEEQPVAVFP